MYIVSVRSYYCVLTANMVLTFVRHPSSRDPYNGLRSNACNMQISEELDESVQTAQDYAIMVDDPYPDDYDPDAWQAFFSQFGWVTFVTIAFDNGELLKVH